MMSEATFYDTRLVQAVLDNDHDLFEETLASPELTRLGVAKALYTASSLGREFFSDMLIHTGNETSYYNGKIIRGIITDDPDMIDDAVYLGGDLHHDRDMPLVVAVKFLKMETAQELIKKGCDIHTAFSPPRMRELYREEPQSPIATKRVINLVSRLKMEAGPADNVVLLRPQTPKFF